MNIHVPLKHSNLPLIKKLEKAVSISYQSLLGKTKNYKLIGFTIKGDKITYSFKEKID